MPNPSTIWPRSTRTSAATRRPSRSTERAIAIDEKTLGPEHPDLATLNNLALLYRDTGRYAEAEPLYERALVILDKSLPPDHPNLVLVRENYAVRPQPARPRRRGRRAPGRGRGDPPAARAGASILSVGSPPCCIGCKHFPIFNP